MRAGQGLFVTGTDTGVGKTWISLGLMQGLRQAGYTVLGMKPVASGCERTAEGLRNEDAVRLQKRGSMELTYEWINPYAFEPPLAPHIAARESGIEIDFASIRGSFERLAARADYVIVEGIGGWEVPLNARQRVSDLAGVLDLSVILVVGMRLGCLNHALLTVEAVERRGLALAGWVANVVEARMPGLRENVHTLRERIAAPCLGFVPYLAGFDVDRIARALNPNALK